MTVRIKQFHSIRGYLRSFYPAPVLFLLKDSLSFLPCTVPFLGSHLSLRYYLLLRAGKAANEIAVPCSLF